MGQDGAPQPAGGAGTGTGLAPNVAAALAYVPAPITGVIMYFLESNPFVRFHAWQSMLFGVAWLALSQVFSAIIGILALVPFLGWLVALVSVILVGPVFWLVGFLIWLLLVIRAFGGASYKLPTLGDIAERWTAEDGPNARGALAYVLGPFTGGYLLIRGETDPFVRFHAWQSVILFVGLFVLGIVFGIVASIFSGTYAIWAIVELARIVIVTLGGVYFWLTALRSAGSGQRFKIPYIGAMAEQYANR
ncbi:MAG: hypothetical protein M1401_19860 [Chloroflexi bacterium]|nr:hypothetical protein [Chloroflexota bacterium]